MKNKLIAIDTEYSKYRKILSLGLYSSELHEEIYFKNDVDLLTFNIHGLPDFFLKENGRNVTEIDKYKDLILSNDYIIGFDINHDLEVCGIKRSSKLFMNKKIIDIKLILNSININLSLEMSAKAFGIPDNKNSLLHTSSYDAKLSFMVLTKILEITNTSLSLLAELTTAVFYSSYWEIDDLSYNLRSISKKLQKNKEETECKVDYLMSENYVYVFQNGSCLYKFPRKYFNGDDKFKQIEYDFNIVGNKFSKNYIKKDLLITTI